MTHPRLMCFRNFIVTAYADYEPVRQQYRGRFVAVREGYPEFSQTVAPLCDTAAEAEKLALSMSKAAIDERFYPDLFSRRLKLLVLG
ncbi:hypothetical protein D9O50_01125 [Oxalobacteraceae bacterium CAVE-383]|nr:hypothetical protein D9O50_01125 [Oxalobacteraceae bacterium CAVE-383]